MVIERSGRVLAMFDTMARMQRRYNETLHPNWLDQGYSYHRAIWIECAELLEHTGWKWWSGGEPDLDQVRLELVDIWHFGLSELIRSGVSSEDLAHVEHSMVRAAGAKPDTPLEDFRLSVERLAAQALHRQAFVVETFFEALEFLPMTLDELFRLYVAKNVLNQFRHDHGYARGKYRKTWAGKEDNEHLAELLDSLKCEPADFPQLLYSRLRMSYGE